MGRIFFPFFPISFLLHLCCMQFFSSDKRLQEIIFQNHPPPPGSRVKWSAPLGLKVVRAGEVKNNNDKSNGKLTKILEKCQHRKINQLVFFGRANVLLAKAHVETQKEGRKWGESKGAGYFFSLPLPFPSFLLSS